MGRPRGGSAAPRPVAWCVRGARWQRASTYGPQACHWWAYVPWPRSAIGREFRPTGPVTPPRAQRRGWGTPAPAPGAQNGQPPRPPPAGEPQHPGGQYGPATRASPSPGTQTPGLAPKLPRSGRLGVFRPQNRPKVPPLLKRGSNCHMAVGFSCHRLAILVQLDKGFDMSHVGPL